MDNKNIDNQGDYAKTAANNVLDPDVTEEHGVWADCQHSQSKRTNLRIMIISLVLIMNLLTLLYI